MLELSLIPNSKEVSTGAVVALREAVVPGSPNSLKGAMIYMYDLFGSKLLSTHFLPVLRIDIPEASGPNVVLYTFTKLYNPLNPNVIELLATFVT